MSIAPQSNTDLILLELLEEVKSLRQDVAKQTPQPPSPPANTQRVKEPRK